MKRRMTHDEQRERIIKRVHAKIDEQHYEYFPETEHTETYDNDAHQRVGIYVRVSTDDIHQSMSYELQKKYYEDFVIRHPKWQLVDIYADEGISGTSLKHRDEFNRMIADAKAGKLDLIITKSVSRFARNVVDFLGMVRMLSEHSPRIGVFFEAECIYSLNERSQMALSFQATMAEEESRNKSRSMETSLRMRLDHGLPLTPKLLGYTQDDSGKLTPDPETRHIPKLIFFMYLYGYSSQQIADALTALGKKTYLGNARWTANGIVRILRNERYCGDVFTRKTFTPDVISHRSIKNRGERPRSRYTDEHEAIVSRDDFIAVQHMLDNAKYRNRSILPELKVIKEGLLQGYVIINPRWSGFTAEDYIRASASAYVDQELPSIPHEVEVTAGEGDYDLRGFEIAHMDFTDMAQTVSLSVGERSLKFSSACYRKMPAQEWVEILIHPTMRRIAVRPADRDNRNAVIWGIKSGSQTIPRRVYCTAFYSVLCELLGLDLSKRYRLGALVAKNDSDCALIFYAMDALSYVKAEPQKQVDEDQAVSVTPKIYGAIPEHLTHSFGREYLYKLSLSDLHHLTKSEWQLRIEGQLCTGSTVLRVTPFEELRSYIEQELANTEIWEDQQHES